eukprot:4054373-Pleurochrysis_carterae.AAC.1
MSHFLALGRGSTAMSAFKPDYDIAAGSSVRRCPATASPFVFVDELDDDRRRRSLAAVELAAQRVRARSSQARTLRGRER